MRGRKKDNEAATHWVETRVLATQETGPVLRVSKENTLSFRDMLVFSSVGPVEAHARLLRSLAAAINAKADEIEAST